MSGLGLTFLRRGGQAHPTAGSDYILSENRGDPEVFRILMSKGVSSDGIGITLDDAAKLSSVADWFKDNKAVVSFNELRFFTNVTTLYSQSFRRCSIKSLNLTNIKTIYYAAFSQSGLEGDILLPNLQEMTTQGDWNGTFTYTNIERVLDLGSIRSLFNGYSSSSGGAFAHCTKLTLVVLPSTITSIGAYSFYNDTNLESVVIKAINPPTLNNVNAFGNTNSTFVIYVPDESIDLYRTTAKWSDFASRIKGISEYNG